MPELLFINKDAKSSSFAHSTEPGEKTAINIHAQRGKKHVRRDRKPILLTPMRPKLLDFELREPSERTVVGKTVPWQSVSGQVLRREGNSRVWWAQREQRLRNQQHIIPRSVNSENNAVDPFNTTCIKIDGEIHKLLDFYVNVFHPNNWPTEAHGQPLLKGKYTFATGALEVVQNCLKDESNMYCVLTTMASQMQVFEKLELQRDVDYYMARALSATCKRIKTHQHSQDESNTAVVDAQMIVNMYYLAVADWYRLELKSSMVHIMRIKQLTDLLGGLKNLDAQLREMIGLGDTFQAAETFAKPFFDASEFDPGKNSEISAWKRRHDLASGLKGSAVGPGQELMRQKHAVLVPNKLREMIEDLADCISILRLSQKTDDSPPGTAHWIHLRDMAIRNRLLATTTADARTEALRAALIMWELMVMTISARKRTIKLIAPKLRALLHHIDIKDWSGHESVLCWILSVGSMSATVGSETESWFTGQIAAVTFSGGVEYELGNEEGLRIFSGRFFYLGSIQAPMIRDLAGRVLQARGQLMHTGLPLRPQVPL